MRSKVLVMLVLIASPLPAQTSTKAPAEDPITVTGEPVKKVCRTEVPIGSNLPRRICTTVAEAKAQAKANERRTDAYIRDKNAMSARTLNCPPPGCH